jgi:hypothetical protein
MNRLSKLEALFIEEDTTTDQDLIPKSKPKWKPSNNPRPEKKR